MKSIEEILNKIASTDLDEIREALVLGLSQPYMRHIIALYDSIWNMTYGASNDPDIIKMGLGDLAPRIWLLNDQEDLMPNPLVAIPEVEALDLSYFEENNFFPELLQYKSLKKLYFAENGLVRIPQELCEMTQLEELVINDELKEITPNIAQLKKLKVLNLANNQLIDLPESMQNMFSLEVLDLSGNYIETVPKFLLNMPKLKQVDLSNNTKMLVESQHIEAFEANGIELIY